jgi:hypothetical protein
VVRVEFLPIRAVIVSGIYESGVFDKPAFTPAVNTDTLFRVPTTQSPMGVQESND